MKRRRFIQSTGLIGAGLFLDKLSFAATAGFPEVRTPVSKRRFQSKSVESAISQFKKKVKNEEVGWLFENCFPNTLDTTVTFQMKDGRPDTYVITGDIDAMWLRDSTAQVWPYLGFIKSDKPLQNLIAGVINRQTECILKDPYANAFYNDENKVGEWKSDLTEMKPGIHERKWEIDSLCYPIRLAYHYWSITRDKSPFDSKWKDAVKSTLKVFREQQRKDNAGPYKFQRTTAWATDGVPLGGYGYPVKPVGLICSIFRPSDDATIYPFLIPSNLFAVTSLRQAAKMISEISNDDKLAAELNGLALEVESAVQKYGIIDHQVFGKVYAFEVNGYGSFNLMDDANIPSLLAMPYLDSVKRTDPVYQNTRKLVLSENNPFYFKGTAAEGVGSPHTGLDLIWPLGIITRGLTSDNEDEIKWCVQTLKNVHGGTGFMHESFHKDDPKKFTRAWFAWANTIFGEFLWKTFQEKPQCLQV